MKTEETRDTMYVTTQLTGKRLKLHSALSYLAIVIGIILILNGSAEESEAMGWGATLAMFGVVWQAITRVRIWWNHK